MSFEPKFMPGQDDIDIETPAEYLARVTPLINDAAKADVTERDEVDGKTP
jgi:hypothetical protein